MKSSRVIEIVKFSKNTSDAVKKIVNEASKNGEIIEADINAPDDRKNYHELRIRVKNTKPKKK